MASLQSFIPDRSVVASGLVGIAAFGISLLLAHYGITISQDQLVPVIITLMGITSHVVPDSAKGIVRQVDGDVKKLAALYPVVQAAFPDQKNWNPNDPPSAAEAAETFTTGPSGEPKP